MLNLHLFLRAWDDWEEDIKEPTQCLFDTQVLASPKEALEHMKSEHAFDLTALRKEKGKEHRRRNKLKADLILSRSGFLSNYCSYQLYPASVIPRSLLFMCQGT